jgi:hypothetical protein
MFPVMLFHYYGQLDEEDIKSIIAYIRTLKPVKNDVPSSSSDFPMNLLINTIPEKAHLSRRPDKSNVVQYGKYLVTASGCIECHTKVDKGMLIAGTEFGGGREFSFPDGSVVRSRNKDAFVSMFHARSDSSILHTTRKPGEFNSIMPWTMFGKMTDEDLGCVYAYLATVKPVRNKVEAFSPAKK